jgi:hypothetical protein
VIIMAIAAKESALNETGAGTVLQLAGSALRRTAQVIALAATIAY